MKPKTEFKPSECAGETASTSGDGDNAGETEDGESCFVPARCLSLLRMAVEEESSHKATASWGGHKRGIQDEDEEEDEEDFDDEDEDEDEDDEWEVAEAMGVTKIQETVIFV